MNGGGFKNPKEQIVPKPLDLHVFVGKQAQIDQHIRSHQKLRNAPGVPVAIGKQRQSNGQGKADISEIEQIKQIVFAKPKRDGNGFKKAKQNNGGQVFFHGASS